jgi:hypothetical protein
MNEMNLATGKSRAVCTIIAKNYLAFARTLTQSFAALHPDYQCYVLIVDEFADRIDTSAEPFEVVVVDELNIPDQLSFCFKYDVTELCTALKAYLLDYLIVQKKVDQLLYLDPDILVTGNLDQLFDRLNTFDIVLTPHLDTDYPEDGLKPDDGHILRSGVFNLGFIGISNRSNASAFLAWWKPKLYWKCIIDHERGYFVDQKFVDLVPAMFDNYYVEKETGYNVAYWNLHSRHIGRDQHGNWTCNEAPLRFFHFSNYRPENPDVISRHVTRFNLNNRPDLVPLFTEYRERLMRAGYDESSRWPYTFDFFDTGEPIPKRMRVSYRSNPAVWKTTGDPFKSSTLKRKAAAIRLMEKDTLSGRLTSGFVSFARKLLPRRQVKPETRDSKTQA